jgi:3',5'-cyclic AMP phosphodiesterase CpdA
LFDPVPIRARLAAASLLLVACLGCGATPVIVLPNERTDSVDTDRFELVARFVHITDTHVVDEQSPGRLTAAASAVSPAWRPHEAYSLQLLDGMVRTINELHAARHTIDFVIHTGDATDNAQLNELEWFVTVFDGGRVDPQSGPDDRDPASLPDPLLDPYHPFDAQGLYRDGVHGDAPTIKWYGLLGNHDRFAVGVFPIVTDVLGRRVSPLPMQERLALTFPVVLDPAGSLSFAPITPAHPGPPPPLNLPVLVQRNPARRYITNEEFIEAHLASVGQPPGHGFDASRPDRTWYSVSPVPGLRLIGLNSATPVIEQPGLAYHEGAISIAQVEFLRNELMSACKNGEYVVVATHHPSDALEPTYATALTPTTFRQLLSAHPCVKLHLAGHWHTNLVIDRSGYIEIVTSSIIDPPQEGRIIEIWREIEPRALFVSLVRKGQSEGERAIRVPTGRPENSPAIHRWVRGVGDNTSPVGTAESFSRPYETSGDRAAEQLHPEQKTQLRYWMFSHLDNIDPPDDSHLDLFDDPLLPMRRIAAELAGAD